MTISRTWQAWVAVFLAVFLSLGGGFASTAADTATSRADRVNVRSRPGFAGEVVTQLKKGQTVAVLETITLRHPTTGEPPVWLKIELPPGSKVWGNTEFVDPSSGTVKADLLNLRSGPTYDHAVVHRVKKGSKLEILDPGKDGWLQVAAPAGAIGFVPASLVGSIPPDSAGSDAGKAPGSAVPIAVASTATSTSTSTSNTAAASPSAPPTGGPTARNPAAPASPGSTAVAANASPNRNSPPNGSAVTSNAVPVSARPPAGPGTSPATTSTTVASVPSTAGSSTSPGSSRLSHNEWLEQFVRKQPTPAQAAEAAPESSTKPGETTATVAETASIAELEQPAADEPTPSRRSRRARRSGTTTVATSSVGAGTPVEDSEPATDRAAISEAIPTPVVPEVPVAPGRAVRREGILVRPSNFLSPSFFALRNRDGGRLMNFVVSSHPEVPPLGEFRGRVVIVRGREYLDRRPMWRSIPVLDVEAIEAVR